MFHNNSQFEKKNVYKKILFKMPAPKIKTKQTTQQNLLGKTYQRKWRQESEDGGAKEGEEERERGERWNMENNVAS